MRSMVEGASGRAEGRLHHAARAVPLPVSG
jgi:hypothetical protein